MPVRPELDDLLDARLPRGLGGRFYGVYPALVTRIANPPRQGMVRIRLPWSPDGGDRGYEVWARLTTFMAGKDRGAWFVPDEQDEVLIAFAGGDPCWPYVLGSLWNGRDAPPATMDPDGNNEIKTLRSRNGVVVTLDDTDGSERLTLETPGGQAVVLSDEAGSLELRDSNGNSITLNRDGITLQSSGRFSVSSSSTSISCGSVTVSAGDSTFSGQVTAATVNSPSIVGASYTPGAGNIW